MKQSGQEFLATPASISHRSVLAIRLSLVAVVCCAPGAFAQDRAPSPPKDASRPAIAEVSRTIPWNTFAWTERRYKIEALRFKARDETGVDWWGSDEVMIKTEDAKGWTVSNEIGGIDSGDTHNFEVAKSCVVAVRPGTVVLGKTSVCEEVGEPAPLGFFVEFWEKDFGLPMGFCLFPFSPQPGGHNGPHCVNDGNGDDFIGNARIDYPIQELEAALPNVGDEVIESITLDPCPGQACAGSGPWDLPDYTFTWRVTRQPDALINLGALLAEAMQRSGARSELEAIVAGLRSLRAPSPHKSESEAVEP